MEKKSMTIQKATYTGKISGSVLDVDNATFYNDGINNPNITIEGYIAGKSQKYTVTLNAPNQQTPQKQTLDSMLGSFGICLKDKFKKYGVYVDGNFYKVSSLADLLVVKQAMGI